MIILYTKNICPKCMATKNQLDELGIDYKAVNLDDSSNKEKANELREQGYLAAPILELNGERHSNHLEITKIIDGLAE